MVHFFARELHGRRERRVVGFPSLVVEVICNLVHGGNDGSNASTVLREKQGCVLVLLRKRVSM